MTTTDSSPARPARAPLTLLALASLALAGCQTVGPAYDEAADVPSLEEIVYHPPLPREYSLTPRAAQQAEDEETEEVLHLMARMAAGFGMELVDNERVQRELAWFRRNPEYLERTFTRGHPYLHHILGELDERGLPNELALLPLIESAYDPFAYSHGRAAGLWQFIPGTGRHYGLRQNWWYDGRRDVVDSTRAALDYLEYLHGLFDGDWLLALAAYNAGQGNVRRAITRNANAGRPTDFWHLPLPRETQAYVPRFLAISHVVADPAQFELELPVLDDVPGFAIVPVEGQIDLALAAELAGVTADDLYRLNAGFNRWATDPEGPRRLLVPVDRAEPFAEALAGLDHGSQLQWERHRVSAGETLIHIARRYSTTPDVIRQVNDIRGNLIRVGDHLMVPRAMRDLTAYTGTADARLEARQNTPRGERRVEHRVRSGESFWSISRRYGVGVRELAQWNGMAPGDTLAVGRELVVWLSGENATASSSTPVTGIQQAALNDRARVRRVQYTVRNGDSLWRIASRFAVSVDELVEWNGISRNAVLRPGQQLVLHVDVTRQAG